MLEFWLICILFAFLHVTIENLFTVCESEEALFNDNHLEFEDETELLLAKTFSIPFYLC